MVALFSLVLAACGGGSSNDSTDEASPSTTEAKPVDGGNLIVDVQTEPQGFNPLAFPNAAYAWLTRQVVDSLYWYDNDGKRAEVLAVGEPETTDGMTWTVKLKDGVKFHNGDAFTAEHVVATLKQTNTPPTNAWGARIGDVKDIVAVDDRTVKIVLGKPNWLMPDVLAVIPMMHKDHLTEQTTVLGTGAFVWTELVPGSHLKLTANKDYHLGKPHLDSVTFRFVPDANTRTVNILQGTSHVAMIPWFDSLDKLKSDDNINLVTEKAAVMLPIHVNVKSPVFSDVRVRQALGYAMDRTRVKDVVFAGEGDVQRGGVIPPALRGFDEENDFFPEKANVTKAKELLKEAGVTTPVTFKIAVYNVPGAVQSMQVIQQDWKAAGFEPVIETMDLASFAKVLLSKSFDMAVSYEFNGTNWGQVGVSPLDNYTVGNYVNFVNYENPKFDELLVKSRATEDPDEQAKLWGEADEMLTKAAVNLIPVVPRLVVAERKDVHGIPTGPLELSYLRLNEAWIG